MVPLIGVMLPDVDVLEKRDVVTTEYGALAVTGIEAAPLVLPIASAVRARLASVEIRDTMSRNLVTSIEILSPVNKRGAGWDEYQRKRQTVLE